VKQQKGKEGEEKKKKGKEGKEKTKIIKHET
jgi:hypothetical protein